MGTVDIEVTIENATPIEVTIESAGTSDMVKLVYDPTLVEGDAFDMDNMAEGSTNLILTAAERANIITNNAKITYPSADSTKVGFISVTQDVDLDTMETDVGLNNTHRTSNGTDHTYINQDIRTTASPTFANVTSSNSATANSHLVRLDQMNSAIAGLNWQQSILDQINFVTSEPAGPTTGDRYINTATGNSSVTTQAVVEDRIYEWNGADWTEFTPVEGWTVWDIDADTNYTYNGTAWVEFGSTVSHNNTTGLQGGTTSEYYHLTSAEHADVPSNTSFRTTPSTVITAGDNLTWDGNTLDLDASISLTGVTTTNLAVDTDTLYVDSVNDRVGIGTTTPGDVLDVYNGHLRLSGSYPQKIKMAGDFSVFEATNSTLLTINSAGWDTVDLKGDILVSSGDLTVDTNTLYVDSTNNRVGIGTTTPIALCDVYSLGASDGSDSPTIQIRNGFSGTRTAGDLPICNIDFYSQDSSGAGAAVRSRIAMENDSTAGSTHNLGFYTSSTDNVLTKAIHLNYNGDVGIGTDSPNSTLQINTSTGYVNFDYTSFGKHFFYSDEAVGTIPLMYLRETNDSNNQPILVLDNDGTGDIFQCIRDTTTVFVVDSNDRVGINNASPSYALDVVGNIAANSGTSDSVAILSSSDNRARIQLSDDDTTSYYITEGGYTSIGGQTSINALNLNIEHSTGNVGIGTTSPTPGSFGKVVHLSDASAPGYIVEDTTNNVKGAFFCNDNVSGLLTVSNHPLYFGTNNDIDMMTLSTAGYLGIGDTTPTAPLEVAHPTANEVAIFRSGDDGARIKIVDDDTTTYLISQDGYTSIGANNALNAGNLNIESSTGNVGIGTDSPSTSLHLYKDGISNTSITIENTTRNPFIDFKNSYGAYRVLVTYTEGDFGLYDIDNSRYVYYYDKSSNFVGIGTTTPDSELEVDGNITATGYTETLTAGESVVAGDVCYLKDDGKYWKADADAVTTASNRLVMALGTIAANNTGTFLVRGQYSTAVSTTGVKYLSATAAAYTGTAPSSAGQVVRIVGTGDSTNNIMHFDPSQDWLVI